MQWQPPEGVNIVGEYWFPAGDPSIVAIVAAEENKAGILRLFDARGLSRGLRQLLRPPARTKLAPESTYPHEFSRRTADRLCRAPWARRRGSSKNRTSTLRPFLTPPDRRPSGTT
jgi:hypothetical protein